MIDKRIKIINWINVALFIIALILESIPISVAYVGYLGGGRTVITGYWSYFGNPLHPVGLITLIVAIATIINLVLNIATLKKDNLKIAIALLTITIIGAILNAIICAFDFATAFNIIILIIYIIQVCLLVAKLCIMTIIKKKLCLQNNNLK